MIRTRWSCRPVGAQKAEHFPATAVTFDAGERRRGAEGLADAGRFDHRVHAGEHLSGSWWLHWSPSVSALFDRGANLPATVRTGRS